MKILRRLSLFFMVIFLIMLFSGCTKVASSRDFEARNGVLDLTGWDMSKKNSIKLDGTWEFYWNKLLESKDFGMEKPDLNGEVPSSWNNYTIRGQRLTGEGFATYRLHVVSDMPANTMLGLRIYNFSSAYCLYINDRLVASNGKVATNARDEIGNYKPGAFMFNIPSQSFDIIVQVSNFSYARGGFMNSMYMGSADAIINLNTFLIGKELFLLGILVILFLFYITIYFLRRELKYSLNFAILCLFVMFALDMVSEILLAEILPVISLRIIILVWYSSIIWSMFFLIAFLHELFKSKFSKAIMRLYLSGAIIVQLIYLFSSTNFFTKYATISNYVDIAGALSTVFIVAIGIKQGYKDGWLNIASIVILAITYIHDNLYRLNIITHSFGELIYVGLIVFLFIQMIIQAQRIKQADENKTAAELSFLQAQIKPHFLYNTLNTIISISRYDVDKTRELLYNLSQYLRRSFDFKDLSQFVPLKNELELAMAYVEIEKSRFDDRIDVNFVLPEDLNVKVPRLILQPLIENAIIHGILPNSGEGQIDVCIKSEGKRLDFKVKDNGVGTDVNKISIFEKNDERGIGLSNIDSRLRKLYGKGLQIRSSAGMGTEITWFIQMNKR